MDFAAPAVSDVISFYRLAGLQLPSDRVGAKDRARYHRSVHGLHGPVAVDIRHQTTELAVCHPVRHSDSYKPVKS